MTNSEFCQTFAPCCSGERNCGNFKVGDNVTFDGGADVYSVRAYVGVVKAVRPDGGIEVEDNEWRATSGMHIRKVRHYLPPEERVATVRIAAAWWVPGGAVGTRPGGPTMKYGKVLARGLDETIYQHELNEYQDPGAFVRAVNTRRTIDLSRWKVVGNDREASRYFDEHQQD